MSDVINYPLSAAIKLCEQLDNDQTNYYLKMLEYKRERDEARNDIIGWENKWRCAVDMAARAELERDEAQEKYATEATEHMLAVNKICGERDEAKEEVRLLQAILDIIRKDSQ